MTQKFVTLQTLQYIIQLIIKQCPSNGLCLFGPL